MVLDKIENSNLYTNLSDKIAKGLAFIKENDLALMELGKYEIDGDDIVAIVQEYDTREIADGKLEAHYKYIDIQYIIDGVELMGIKSLKDQVPYEKNLEKDVAFYTDECSFFKVETGMFTIFFPEDLHMPCIKHEEISKVKKVVIKVSV